MQWVSLTTAYVYCKETISVVFAISFTVQNNGKAIDKRRSNNCLIETHRIINCRMFIHEI